MKQYICIAWGHNKVSTYTLSRVQENESLKDFQQRTNYIFPLEEVLAEKFDAVWITSPIYSTGTCYCETELNKIKVLLERYFLASLS